MAHVLITVDGITLVDAVVNKWQAQPPPELDQFLHPAEPQPWSIPVAVILAPNILADNPTHIVVTTHRTGWTMNVTRP